jgi:hypothetical protein
MTSNRNAPGAPGIELDFQRIERPLGAPNPKPPLQLAPKRRIKILG